MSLVSLSIYSCKCDFWNNTFLTKASAEILKEGLLASHLFVFTLLLCIRIHIYISYIIILGLCVCVCVCVFVFYRRPQFSTDLHQFGMKHP